MVAQVVGLVEAPGIGLDLPLDVRGTAFQQRVWRRCGRFPSARQSDMPRSRGASDHTRVVAAACAANNLAVAIPCHRVVRKAGYAWGVERSRTLLDREKSQS
jgi:AraC family transcriptional regulator of adaptative response/methylated-DNA-[protein]-cysteine methyltransferase